MNSFLKSSWALSLLAVAALPLIAACEGDSTGPGDESEVSLSVVAPVPEQDATVAAGRVTYIEGENTLGLTRVAVVLREIELEADDVEDCDDQLPDSDDDDDCEEFEAGPFLLELALDGTVETVLEVRAPAGAYDELEFEIDTPDDDSPADQAFRQAHPGFDDVSILVEGTWNGEPFVFLQDLSEEQERELSPPLVLDGTPANVTLVLDVSTWFRAGDGALIDPRTANEGGPNESLVESNIEASIDAFDDDDRDGDDDGDDDD